MRWWRLSWWRLSWWRGNWRRVWDIGLAFCRRVCTFCILRRGLGSSRRGKEERKIYGGFLRRRWRRRYLKQPATEEKWLAKVVVIQIQDFKLLQFCYLLRYFPGKWIVSKNTANKNKVDVDAICIYWLLYSFEECWKKMFLLTGISSGLSFRVQVQVFLVGRDLVDFYVIK